MHFHYNYQIDNKLQDISILQSVVGNIIESIFYV